MDANLRKSLFRILDSIKKITINKETPTIKYEKNKCKKCEYKEMCLEDFTNPIDL
ncbi:Dna2/Cas4 domain-containing protein [Methanobrevibacter sp. 87.7]|uniref:Dna2/Cas4 domain-containing protein n=1 Tax=Methanobrevibacter sp. 87.7 TaxID=387957 RepID=UPI00373FD243